MDGINKEIYRKFRSRGQRMTRPRKAILDILRESSRHMSVDELYLAVRKAGKQAGVTTIYRTLDCLTRAGALRKIALANGRSYYEISDKKTPRHHHHLICRNCQKVIDYSDFVKEEIRIIKKLEKVVARVHKFAVEDHQIAFTGLCKSCRRWFNLVAK